MAKTVKSNQEQATAAWVDYLNQARLTDLIEALNAQELNLQHALSSLKWANEVIQQNLIETNRGGEKGIHGFIAEVAEVGIGNAKNAIQGRECVYEWLDDNGPSDIGIDKVLYQMKFVESGKSFSLNAVVDHLEKYPDHLESGRKYIIPKDFFESVKTLSEMNEQEASRLSTSTDGVSYKQWRRINELFANNEITMDDIEPSQLEYGDVQKSAIRQTMDREERSLRNENERLREVAYEGGKPTLGQGIRATAGSAAIEGAGAFCMTVAGKIRGGKPLRDFSQDDWLEIAGKTGSGAFKGSVRGASIYTLSNFTATPAAAASALCTASFSVAEQAHRFRKNEIDEVEFIQESEIVCLDAAVSALSSALGQAVIPVPVLGAVIGNTVGIVICQTAKGGLSAYEQKIIERYEQEQSLLDERLAAGYGEALSELREDMNRYCLLLKKTFHPNPVSALNGSVELALALGVPQSEMLDDCEKIDAYFLE